MSPLNATFCPSLHPYFFMRSRPTRRPERSWIHPSAEPETILASSKTFRSASGSWVENRAKLLKADWSMYWPPNHCIRTTSATPGSWRILAVWPSPSRFVIETSGRVGARSVAPRGGPPHPASGRRVALERREERPEDADDEERKKDRAQREE